MKGLDRSAGLAMAILALGLAGPVGAQESLDAGKTGAQLFASDCALCHKSPQGLAKSGGLFGLSGFLKQHYTASQETANVVAKYLESFGNAPSAPAKRTGPTKHTAKGDEKANPEARKPDEKKSDVAKSGQGKSRKPGDAKTPESKFDDVKPAESKSSEPKSSEVKPAEPKPAEAKSSEPKPEAKPDKPEKSD
jgi:hypothetical protein